MDGFEVEEVQLAAQQKEGEEEDSMMKNIMLQQDQKEYIRVDSSYGSKMNTFKYVKKKGSGRSPFLGSSVLYQYCNVENVDTKILDMMGKINGVHTCIYCGKETRDKTDLRKHAETHIDGLGFFCPKCISSKKYPLSAMLRSHINKEHRDDADFFPWYPKSRKHYHSKHLKEHSKTQIINSLFLEISYNKCSEVGWWLWTLDTGHVSPRGHFRPDSRGRGRLSRRPFLISAEINTLRLSVILFLHLSSLVTGDITPGIIVTPHRDVTNPVTEATEEVRK